MSRGRDWKHWMSGEHILTLSRNFGTSYVALFTARYRGIWSIQIALAYFINLSFRDNDVQVLALITGWQNDGIIALTVIDTNPASEREAMEFSERVGNEEYYDSMWVQSPQYLWFKVYPADHVRWIRFHCKYPAAMSCRLLIKDLSASLGNLPDCFLAHDQASPLILTHATDQ